MTARHLPFVVSIPSARAATLAAAILSITFSLASPAVGQVEGPRLGAAIHVLSDGAPPWEDRPITVEGVGVLSGTLGVSDPGDDLGSDDGIVRTLDSVIYRLSYDVLDAPAKRLGLTAVLSPGLVWQPGEESRLDLEGCPGGADVSADRRRLSCLIGDVDVPPALTGVVDAIARVAGDAPHGLEAAARIEVRAIAGRPDADPVRCPEAISNGCGAASLPITVSAAVGADTRKTKSSYPYARRHTREGVDGFMIRWHLSVMAGGDGDPRGEGAMAPEPIELHDWWRMTQPDGIEVADTASLIECGNVRPERAWSCSQPKGPGSPIAIVLDPRRIHAPVSQESGDSLIRSRQSSPIASTVVQHFVPLTDITTAGGIVHLKNCFATTPGDPTSAEFRPVDAAGNPNLGGRDESLDDNCSTVILDASPRGGSSGFSQPTLSKRYETSGGRVPVEVLVGERVVGVVSLKNNNGSSIPEPVDVVVCDAFDDRTQRIDTSDLSFPAAAARDDRELDADEYILEFATGPWGRGAPTGAEPGSLWHAQSNARCDDHLPINPAGWVTAGELDATDAGAGRLNADQVNVVRLRLLDPLPAYGTGLLRTPLVVRDVPTGTLVINYSSAHTEISGTSRWVAGGCNGKAGGTCPDPPALSTRSLDPGPDGDALVVVESPTEIQKAILTGARWAPHSAVVRAGTKATFRLTARSARILRPLPDGAVARSAVITDHLPAGLSYVPGSAWRQSEDRDRDGVLDLSEDIDGDGMIDSAAPISTTVLVDHPTPGATTLVFRIGDLVANREWYLMTYDAMVDPLAPGGISLVNKAQIRSASEGSSGCHGPSIHHPGRCADAEVQVANTSRAAIEKVAITHEVPPDASLRYRLRTANLTLDPIEWLDAVDILPWPGDGREPRTRFGGTWTSITVSLGSETPPLQVWASATAPGALDVAGGSLPDGVIDPVRGWGAPGAGLGGDDWPCLLDDVGLASCSEIVGAADVTALRLWAPDPDPDAAGTMETSRIPSRSATQEVDVYLAFDGALPGDLFHNAWGGRFEGMVLPVFESAVARVRFPSIYVPIVGGITVGERPPTPEPPCEPRPLALSIVIDASTSMRRPSGIGGAKIDTVIEAVDQIIGVILEDNPENRIAISAFNETAWNVHELTDYAPRLHFALAGLRNDLEEGTRLDLGLQAGAESLAASPLERRAMIFLTDGLPNRVPTPSPGGRQEDTVLAVAEAVRAAGITVHTVGYGDPDAPDIVNRVNRELLADIAGPSGTSQVAPNAAALRTAFEAIGSDLTCPSVP